jgi:hypothetical protein
MLFRDFLPKVYTGGGMVLQLKPDEKEIIMKYNVIYDIVKFKLPIA